MTNRHPLDDRSVPQLRELAKSLGIRGYYAMRRNELIDALDRKVDDTIASAVNADGTLADPGNAQSDDAYDTPDPHLDPTATCPACAAGQPHADDEPRSPYAPLDAELVDGLTIWTGNLGAQVRLEAQLLEDVDGNTILNADGSPAIGPAVGSIALAIADVTPRSSEVGEPWLLTADDARALRDLLNIATARHFI